LVAFAALVPALSGNSQSWLVAMLTVVGAALLSLIGGVLSGPGVAQSVWVMVAVALNVVSPLARSPWARSLPGRLLPLVAAFVLLAAFGIRMFVPGIRAAASVREARAVMPLAEEKRQAAEKATGPRPAAVRRAAADVIDRLVLPRLAAASQAEPRAVGPVLEQVRWLTALWDLDPPDTTVAATALVLARYARQLDPESPAGHLAEFRLLLRLAERQPAKRREQFAYAARLIVRLVEIDPALAAGLQFQMGRARFAVKDLKEGKAAAGEADRLDRAAPGPRYRLTDKERAQVASWLAGPAL
jgi:hypothetical protein